MNEPGDRLHWTTYFMAMAYIVALRSPDAQTKHGSVLVDKNNKIIGTGFNGFPTGAPDNLLPNTRPDKYLSIVHSELNCLLNCYQQDLSECTLYVTGPCCHECLKLCLHRGIRNFVYGHRKHVIANEEQQMLDQWCRMYKINFYYFDPYLLSNILDAKVLK